MMEDSVCLGAAKMIAVAKSETQVVEASKTLLLACTRLEGLKKELSKALRGTYVR